VSTIARSSSTAFGSVKIPSTLSAWMLVTSGRFRPDEHKAVATDAISRDVVSPRRGDLLFSRANTRELVAATCLVETDEPQLFLPDKVWRVTPRERVASTPYLRFLLSHDGFRLELTKTATGTSGSMLNVSMEKLRQLQAPLPPWPMQQRFSKLVWATLQTRARCEQAWRESDALFGAIMHSAFSATSQTAQDITGELPRRSK
jgi:type I restriction enzyme S subunit